MNNNNYLQTKICKYCRSEIDNKAKICPYCHKKQSHPLLTAVAIFFGLPFMIGLFSGLANGPDNSSSNSQITEKTTAIERKITTAKAIETQIEETTTTVEEATTEPITQDTSLTITGHHLTKDYKDRDILVVNYDFYNGEKEPKSFMWLFDDKCFQNGVSCDDWVVGVDELEQSDIGAEVQPGYTQHLSIGYELKDLSDVNIVVEKYLNSNIVYINETLKLQ